MCSFKIGIPGHIEEKVGTVVAGCKECLGYIVFNTSNYKLYCSCASKNQNIQGSFVLNEQ